MKKGECKDRGGGRTITYRLFVGGDCGDDEHENEGDDDLQHQRLHVASRRQRRAPERHGGKIKPSANDAATAPAHWAATYMSTWLHGKCLVSADAMVTAGFM